MLLLKRGGFFPAVWAVVAGVMIIISSTVGMLPATLNSVHAQTSIAGATDLGEFPGVRTDKVDVQLLDGLAAGGSADFWVNFDEAADLDDALNMDWSERGWFVYEELVKRAEESQARAAALLDDLNVEYESFWIANAIYVRSGNFDVMSALSALSEVSEVTPPATYAAAELEPAEVEAASDTAADILEWDGDEAPANTVEWGVADIRAPLVWLRYRTEGEGIVVGSIDTGALYGHEALVNQYRGNKGDGTFDHNYSWHDPSARCGSPASGPCDNMGTGTHALGVIVGDGGDGNQIGVAPKAQWIAAKGCEVTTCSDFALLSSMQFMLAPTDLQGENADPDMRPHIVNNSWRGRNVVDSKMHEAVQAWVAAGIFPVFGGGDIGPACGTVVAPAMLPESYAVGRYDSGYIALGSSRGPSPEPHGVIKPDITAPGINIRSAWNNGEYSVQNGTGLSAAHVAGAVALLWSGTSAKGDIARTQLALGESAFVMEDLSCGGDPGFDNVWGHGRLDALGAFQFARSAAVGYATGFVTDANDGSPVEGAAVTALQEESIAGSTSTLSDGSYRLWLPPGMYIIEVTSPNYDREWTMVTIGEDGQEVPADFSLKTGLLDPGLEDGLTFQIVEGTSETKSFLLKNTGERAADFEFSIYAPFLPLGFGIENSKSDSGLFDGDPAALPHWEGSSLGLHARPADGEDVPGPGPEPEPGEVIKSWDSGLAHIFGAGYDGDVIISSASPNDRSDYKFTVDGEFITKWPTQGFGGALAGDMSYDPNHNLLWQIAASRDTDKCVYGLNPDTGAPLEKICGYGWTDAVQHGLAYRSDNDTFYAGGWFQNIIYQFRGLSHRNPGEIIAQHPFPMEGMSGLTWDGDRGVLWVATNSETDSFYALRPDDGWGQAAIIGHPGGGLYRGGGVSADEDGNLWTIEQGSGMVYLLNSGLPGDPAKSPWLAASPDSGTLDPGGDTAINVTADAGELEPGMYVGALHIKNTGGGRPWVSVPVTLNVLLADAGWVEGTITDANDDEPIAGASVTAVDDSGEIVHVAETDDEGQYRFQLYAGDYTIEAEAKNYDPSAVPLTIGEDGEEHTIDLALATALGSLAPEVLELTVEEGQGTSGVLTLDNTGTREMNWKAYAYRLQPFSTGSVDGAEERTRLQRNPDFDPLAQSAEGLYADRIQSHIPAARGDVLASWDTGLVSPWGMGFHGGLLISNPSAGAGDNHNYKFTEEGGLLAKWPAPEMIMGWVGDMAYDSTHNVIWQVAVGDDNCLFGLDPDDGSVIKKLCGAPWSYIAQRGVAYRPDDDTLYVGGWNEDIIYHIKGLSHGNPGEVIEQVAFEHGGLAGLAWNDSAKVLWAATNSPEDNIYAFSPDDGWAQVAVLAHPEPGGHRGAGLTLNSDGHLWMISRTTRRAYLVDGGIPQAGGVAWLEVSPDGGVVESDGTAEIQVAVDAAALEPGAYEAFIVVETDSGRIPNVPARVALNVVEAVSGYVGGLVTDANDGEPVAGAEVTAALIGSDLVRSTRTGADGGYELRLPLGEYVVTVTADDYADEDEYAKLVTEDSKYEINFSLKTGRGTVSPDAIELTVNAGATGGSSFTLSNSGDLPMSWALTAKGLAFPGIAGGGAGEAAALPGDVIKSWNTELPSPWGVGFDGDVLISNPSDGHNYRFTVDGEFIARWSTAAWSPEWAADLTYDSTHDLIWQVSVGGDNCLYGLDPHDGTQREKICNPIWTVLSQRGVTYRADDDTFYIGGWNQRVIHQITGLSHDNPGEIVKQYLLGQNLSGLAWNPTAGVLWAATNSATDTIFGLTPDEGWNEIAQLEHPEGGGTNGAGVAMDDSGNLWVPGQKSGMMYLVATGIPHIPVHWLEAGPDAGTLAPGGSETIQVDVDASDLIPGTYEAELHITTNGGREPKVLAVSVTMNVIEPGSGPELTVTEPEEGTHTNDDTITVAGTAIDPAGGDVTVAVNGEEADVQPDGSFEIRVLLPEDDGPFEITVVATGEGGSNVTETRTIVVDRTAPVITAVLPDEDVVMEWGDELTISFTSESGLDAAYQVFIMGAGEEGLPGVPMTETAPGSGVYEGTYTAPDGAAFTGAEIEVYAVDKAGNMAQLTAAGTVTVVPPEDEPVRPPTVVINEPADGFLTNRDAVRVSGTATDDQDGQGIEQVTVNGREVTVGADGTFTTRIILWEGDNVITVTATNTAGETATEAVIVEADWTAPELTNLDPAADITLEWGETYTFRFESETGLEAAYQIVVGGRHGTWITRGIPIKGTPMTETAPGSGVYEATYTAPAGVLMENAIVQFNAADPARNVIMTTAPGELTVTE